MSVRWNDIFQLPEAALAGGKRVPKAMLARQAALTKREQRTLDKMRRLEHFATVTKATTHMLPRVDDERDIQSVIFLRCEMAGGTQAVSEVAGLLHRCFPNPTVIMQEAGESVCVSVSLTRKSHAERGATVIENIESTGLFDAADDAYAGFLETLAYYRLPQDDMWAYLQTMAWNVMLSRGIGALGFYPTCGRADRERMYSLVRSYESTQSEIKRLYEERRGDDVSLNESAKLRMRIRKMEDERDTLANEIKEICHG